MDLVIDGDERGEMEEAGLFQRRLECRAIEKEKQVSCPFSGCVQQPPRQFNWLFYFGVDLRNRIRLESNKIGLLKQHCLFNY